MKMNGISKTALMCAHCMGNSGIPYCREISLALPQIENITRQIFGDYFKEAMALIPPLLALRHLSLTAAIKATGVKGLLEIGCGLNPRCFILSEDPKFSVVETDLEPIVNLKIELLAQLLRRRYNYYAEVADARSTLDLIRASNLLPAGPIAIACAGLFPYFPISEKNLIVSAINEVMYLRPGSVWLATSQDFITAQQLDMLMANETLRAIINGMHEISEKTFYDNAFPKGDDINEFLNYHRLKFASRKQNDIVPNFPATDLCKGSEIWEMRLV